MSLIQDVFKGLETMLLTQDIPAATIKNTSNDIKAGDITIESITLISEDQQRRYELIAQCKAIDIYESITSPVICAELSMIDSIGLYQSFPILGEEYVSIKFKTPGTQKSSSYLFRVNRLMNKEVAVNNLYVTYTLQLVSAELIKNASRLITKPFKDNIHTIVETILKDDLQTSKPIRVDKTSGIEEGVLSNLKPLTAIDYLRKRAVSAEFKTSAFVFFESRDGFVFTTVEKLIKDGKRNIDSGKSDKTFFFDTVRHENISTVDIRNIIAYNQLTFGDTITKIGKGGLHNEVSSYDLITGNIKKIKYTNDGKASTDGIDKNSAPINTKGFISKHSKTTGLKRIIPISSDLPTTNRVERTGILTAFTHNLTQNIVQVYVYGDSELKVGDVIKCNFPSAIDVENAKVARLESGNYLISKLRHIIMNSDRPQHMISLELLKGNLSENA
jgi:hypothetical protein